METEEFIVGCAGFGCCQVFLGGDIALKKTFLQEFPELKGNPEIGKWYEVAPEGAVSAKGSPYQIYKMFSGFLHYLVIISLEMSDEPYSFLYHIYSFFFYFFFNSKFIIIFVTCILNN